MPLYDTLKPAPLADTNDIDESFAVENLDQDAIANLHRAIAIGRAFNLERHFAHELHRRKIVFREMSLGRLGQPRLFHKLDQANLGGLVPVLGGRLVLRHHARTSLQHRDRADVALRVKQLRHADLLAQNACYLRCHFLLHPAWVAIWRLLAGTFLLVWERPPSAVPRASARVYLCSLPNALISTSTPAGRSSFISASTVCCVGSRMSSRRLWVRISNCSRDFLSTCGDRNTQYLFFTVGSGMGPAICAPVRRAVSTISPVDWSSTR